MSQNIGSINAWTCCNAYACVPFFTHTTRAFGVISLKDWVRVFWLPNLLLKLAKQVVKASIIFSTSLTLRSPSWPFDCSAVQFPLPCLGPLDLWAFEFFNAWSLWRFGLMCPGIPQWWQKCWVLEPLYDFGRDFPLPLGLTTDWLGGLVKNRWSVTFRFFSDFTFSTTEVSTTDSLAFTNFISLDILTAELLSPVYPNPLMSENGFWWASTSSSFLEETHSTLALAWTTSNSRNFIFE